MQPTLQDLYGVMEATWPPAKTDTHGCWTIRDGQNGGKRASAATALRSATDADIPAAEKAMIAIGQIPLFMIRAGDQTLDQMLAKRGYVLIDPTGLYVCPIEVLTQFTPPRLSAFCVWPPLAIAEEIWANGDIDAGRLAVMQRAAGPKTALLGRADNRAAATAFVAMHRHTGMLYALEVLPEYRRKGVAQTLMAAAAHWAKKNGARFFSVLTTGENLPANQLYASLGMKLVGNYHYRIAPRQKAVPD